MIIMHSDNGRFRNQYIQRVDQLADDVRRRVIGDPVRIEEYKVAEEEAKAYKAKGYSNMPQSVKSWAEAKKWTGQQAADDILTASAQWRAALYGIRDARLKAKEAMRLAKSSAEIEAIYASYSAQIQAMMAGVV